MTIETAEQIQQFPYHHSFERYFESNGKKIDRLALILEHGVLSPESAGKKGIPYRRLPLQITGINDYYDLIFVYSTQERLGWPIPGEITLYFDQSLPTITRQEMKQMFPGWPVFSMGEAYVRGNIAPEHIKEIRTRRGEKKDVEEMVKRFQLTAKVS